MSENQNNQNGQNNQNNSGGNNQTNETPKIDPNQVIKTQPVMIKENLNKHEKGSNTVPDQKSNQTPKKD